jgi:hypothetical protein
LTNQNNTGLPAATTAAGSWLTSNPWGLTAREMRAEICRCLDRGWQAWELRRRFDCHQ